LPSEFAFISSRNGLLGDPFIVAGDAMHHFPGRGVVHLLRHDTRLIRASAPVLDVVEQVGGHGRAVELTLRATGVIALEARASHANAEGRRHRRARYSASRHNENVA
jgi:hypothetical protein